MLVFHACLESRCLSQGQEFNSPRFRQWRGVRAVYGAGLENRRVSQPRGFESHPLLQILELDVDGAFLHRFAKPARPKQPPRVGFPPAPPIFAIAGRLTFTVAPPQVVHSHVHESQRTSTREETSVE